MTDDTASSQRCLPDPKKCRTRYRIYTLGFTHCLVENPDACEYAERSAYGVYCEHPDRRRFDETDPP